MGSALGDIFLERIEVDDHEVERRDFILLHLLQVGRIVAPCQDSSENLGVEGLDPSAEDRGVSRDIFDLCHLVAFLGQEIIGSSG